MWALNGLYQFIIYKLLSLQFKFLSEISYFYYLVESSVQQILFKGIYLSIDFICLEKDRFHRAVTLFATTYRNIF
jgi:hypothetical protein